MHDIIDSFNLIGAEGKSFTVLRPSGTAIINNKRYDVVTAGEYIKRGTIIVVTAVEGSKIVVMKKD